MQKADFAHDGGGQRFGIRNSSTVAYSMDWIELKSKTTHTKHWNEHLFPKRTSTNKWSDGESSTNSKLSHTKGLSTGSIKNYKKNKEKNRKINSKQRIFTREILPWSRPTENVTKYFAMKFLKLNEAIMYTQKDNIDI